MNGRRAVVGLCMLCALLVSAFAAQSASAITGTTAVTCAKTGVKQSGATTFKGDHCLSAEGAGEFKHWEITEETELSGAAGSATSVLKSTVGGVGVTLTSTSLTGTGTMINTEEGNGEHVASGTGSIVYSGVTVSPFSKCFVYTDNGTGVPGAKGVVDTEPLKATTKAQGDALLFEPVNAEKVFARFWILDEKEKGTGGECTIHGTYVVTGSVKAVPSGATAATVHGTVTTENTLKMGQGATFNKAGIEGSLTIKGSKLAAKAFSPLSVTTVTT